MGKVTKKDQLAFMRAKVTSDDRWAVRGLLTIYDKQTEAEKAVGTTKEDNGVGFSGVDAEFLTSLAEQYQGRNYLSPKQMAAVKKNIARYAGQLVRFSDPAKLLPQVEKWKSQVMLPNTVD